MSSVYQYTWRYCWAALRVGLAGRRVRILGSVLTSESVPKQASESVSRVYKHWCRVAFFKCTRDQCLYTREMDSDVCFRAPSDFKTDPKILTRLIANPTLRAARHGACRCNHTHRHALMHNCSYYEFGSLTSTFGVQLLLLFLVSIPFS